MATKEKLPITIRAVTQRLNRKLRLNAEMLKATRGNQWKEFGDYYVVNFRKNVVTHTRVDLEKMARALGVLKDWEKVE